MTLRIGFPLYSRLGDTFTNPMTVSGADGVTSLTVNTSVNGSKQESMTLTGDKVKDFNPPYSWVSGYGLHDIAVDSISPSAKTRTGSYTISSGAPPATSFTLPASDVNRWKSQGIAVFFNMQPARDGLGVWSNNPVEIEFVDGSPVTSATILMRSTGGTTRIPMTISDDGLLAYGKTGTGQGVSFEVVKGIIPAPDPYVVWKQEDINALSKNSTLTVNGSIPKEGDKLFEGDALKIVANDVWLIRSAAYLLDGVVRSFDIKDKGVYAVDTFPELQKSGSVFGAASMNVEQPTPKVAGDFNKIYKVDSDIMKSLYKERYLEVSTGDSSRETVDLGEYILNLIELPFTIDPDYVIGAEAIQLGYRTIKTTAEKVNSDTIRLDLGVISVVGEANDFRDYSGVSALIHLPRISPISLDLEYVIDKEVSVTYDVDVYSGRATVNIYSNAVGEPPQSIVLRSVDLGINIPYMSKENVDNASIEVGGDNGVRTAFIELVKTEINLPDGFFTIPVTDEGDLSDMKGFVVVDNIELETEARNREVDMILQALNSGVIIK